MFKQYLINKAAGYIGIPNTAMAYWHAFNKVGKGVSMGLPDVLMSLGARNFFRGLLNRFVIPVNLDWVWPYWVIQQYNPLSKSFISRGFQLASLNMARRNWTAIGAINSEKEAIVDQRGLVVPQNNGWSVDFWIYYKDKLYAPSQVDCISQYLCQDLPIVITEFKIGDLVINAEVFVEKVSNEDMIFHRNKIVNMGDSPENVSFIYSIRPYNTEGLSMITSIEYKDQEIIVNEKVGMYLPLAPDEVLCNNYEEGDVSLYLNKKWQQKEAAFCSTGFCTGMVKYNLTVEPKKNKEIKAFIPIERKHSLKGIEKLEYDQTLTECIASWRDRLDNRGMQIQVPDARLQAAFQANRAHLLVFHDGDSITPGPFSYHFFWYRDAAYMINALDKMGFLEEAEQILNTYPHRQRKLGHFCSQSGEWDSNGQAVWTLSEHYRYSNNKQFLKHVYPAIAGAISWIDHNLPQNKNPLFDGLHRPGLSAEHFGSNDYYYWDDFWSLAGIREAIRVANVLEKHRDVKKFQQIYDRLEKSINNSLKEVEKRFDRPMIPISPSPSRRMDSAAIGSISCVYPLRLFDVDDKRFLNTLKYIEEHCVYDGGFFHDVMHAGFGTYLTAHVAECYVALNDKRAIKMLNWLLDKATDTYTWPEAINPLDFGGNMGDGHHGWAAADFLILVRNMLFMEKEEKLELLPCVDDEWFSPGKKIVVANAPTYFGTINFQIKTHRNMRVELDADFNFHYLPEAIEVNLPENIKSLDFRDKEYPVKKGKVIINKSEYDVTK
ncbi:MAG: hypothetical protein ABIH39_00305 [Candidatus Margulisiibacteriota bacterium]